MSNKKNSLKARKRKRNIKVGKQLKSLKSISVDLETKNQDSIKIDNTHQPETKKNNKDKNYIKTIFDNNFLIKIICSITIIAIIIFVAKYVYDNHINKDTYRFKTNIAATTVKLSNDLNKIESTTEKIDDTILSVSKKYNQIKIINNICEETIPNNNIFFKYYGDKEIILLADDNYTIDYVFFTPDESLDILFEADNDAIVISDNILTAKSNGETTVYACFGDSKIEVLKVLSTNLLVKRPKDFDDTRDFLSCEQYTDKENTLLDKILEKKIDTVGYQTRAGAVEALRFMSLDLPYRIDYFNENGRLPYVDAQGRYYHKGLYLSKSKYAELLDPNDENIGTWGCKLYSIPLEGYENNGLDCSGLLGWALYNAGYDPGDIKGSDLLFELGDIYDSKKIIDSGKVKVGDFVHNEEATSHIGMIVGIDEEYYYVCQSIWYKPNGVCISKYTKNQFTNHWLQIALMDKYYKSDGNLTNMWY